MPCGILKIRLCFHDAVVKSRDFNAKFHHLGLVVWYPNPGIYIYPLSHIIQHRCTSIAEKSNKSKPRFWAGDLGAFYGHQVIGHFQWVLHLDSSFLMAMSKKLSKRWLKRPTRLMKSICLMMFAGWLSFFPMFLLVLGEPGWPVAAASFFPAGAKEPSKSQPSLRLRTNRPSARRPFTPGPCMRFFVQIGSQNVWLTMGFSIGEVDGGGLSWFFRLNWGWTLTCRLFWCET